MGEPLPQPSDRPAHRRIMLGLLAAGIILRLAVFLSAGPFNPDTHYDVIQYIAQQHSLPDSNELGQSYHPPLYYILMVPLERAWPGQPRVIQFASFIISSLNLLLAWWLLNKKDLISNPIAKTLALAFACFVPQYVMFGNFVSNDTLTILIGTIIFAAMVSYIQKPTAIRLISLAIAIGAGLLTKGTFLLTGPALAIPVALIESRRRGVSRGLATTVGFCVLWVALGCYKYVENTIYIGHPIVHNLDAHPEIVRDQTGTWKGWQSVYDINVFKLIHRPILKVHDVFSYPLLMYATFWYPHYPDSTFNGNFNGYQWVGSVIYAAAIVPTLIFLLGLILGLWLSLRPIDANRLILGSCILLLISNVLVVMAAALKYDTWPAYQSRLCFQSMMPILIIFGTGWDMPGERWLQRVAAILCWIAASACLLYFIIEILLVLGWLPMGAVLQP